MLRAVNARVLPGAEAFRFDAGPIGALLQHGFSGCPASMRPFGQWLAEHGVSSIGPRLPGHGTTWQDLETTAWQDWERESEAALVDLASRCTTVIAVGLPVVRLFTRTAKGVGNDIKKPGQDEIVYDRVPLKAANQLGKLYRTAQKDLPSMSLPLLVFSSREDHLVKPRNSKYVYEHAPSSQKQFVPLTNSYHVATLDYDAEVIFERTLAFAQALASPAPETSP